MLAPPPPGRDRVASSTRRLGFTATLIAPGNTDGGPKRFALPTQCAIQHPLYSRSARCAARQSSTWAATLAKTGGSLQRFRRHHRGKRPRAARVTLAYHG